MNMKRRKQKEKQEVKKRSKILCNSKFYYTFAPANAISLFL